MLKKINGLVLIYLMYFFLSGCVKLPQNNSWQDIKERGKLVVAISPDYAPFEFQSLINGKNKIVGADVQLAETIAQELGVRLELSPMTFNNVLTNLRLGKADIAISGISYTKERAASFDFSIPYYEADNAIVVRKNDATKYRQASDFFGKKIGVQKGSLEEKIAKENLSGAQIVGLIATNDVINELKSGHVDAVSLETPVAAGYIANNKDLSRANFSLTVKEGDAKAIAMTKGNSELKAKIDNIITDIKAKAEFKTYLDEAVVVAGNK